MSRHRFLISSGGPFNTTSIGKVLALLGSGVLSISSLTFIIAQSERGEHQYYPLQYNLEIDVIVSAVLAIVGLSIAVFGLTRLPSKSRGVYALYSMPFAVSVFGLLFLWFSVPSAVPPPPR